MIELAQQELAEAEHGFDNVEPRFRGVFVQGVQGLLPSGADLVTLGFPQCAAGAALDWPTNSCLG